MIITIIIMALMSGCGDGNIGPLGPQGAAGATGATGATGNQNDTPVLGSLKVNAVKTDGTPATGFNASLVRSNESLESVKLEGSDVQGTGTYTFEKLAAGTYDLFVQGSGYYSYFERVILNTGENKVIDVTLVDGIYLSEHPDPNNVARARINLISGEGDVTNLVNNIAQGAGFDPNSWTAYTSMDVNPQDGYLYMTADITDPTNPGWYLLVFDMAGPTFVRSVKLPDTIGSSESYILTDLAFDGSGNLYGYFCVPLSGADQLGQINLTDGSLTLTPRPTGVDRPVEPTANGIAFSPTDGQLYYVTTLVNGVTGMYRIKAYTWDITGGTFTEFFDYPYQPHQYYSLASGAIDFEPGNCMLYVRGALYYSSNPNSHFLGYLNTVTREVNVFSLQIPASWDPQKGMAFRGY